MVPRASRASILDTCLKRSYLWPKIVQLKLTRNMRAIQGADEFAEWLLDVGNGNVASQVPGTKDPLIPVPIASLCQTDLVDVVYEDMDPATIQGKIILCPKNDDTMIVNEMVLNRIHGDDKIYLSADSIQTDEPREQANYPMEFLNSLTPSGMPPHRLRLKVGATVMLLRNLDLKQGLCNGTRLRIIHLHTNIIDAEVMGRNNHTRVLIPRIVLAPTDANLPFVLQRRQFPLRLCFSMTINKAQGQTFSTVGLLLRKPVFSHGQLYVAFSRARSFDSLHVSVINGTHQGIRDRQVVTPNVVYKEALM